MQSTTEYNFLGTSFLDKLLQSIFEPNLNVCRETLTICNLLLKPEGFSKGAVIYFSNKKEKVVTEDLMKMLISADLSVNVETLKLINNLLFHSIEDFQLDVIMEKMGFRESLLV